MSQNTWNIIEERTKLKENVLNTKTVRKKSKYRNHTGTKTRR